MSEKSIIFSTPMVQAILDGRKTQTRRVVRPQLQELKHSDYLMKDYIQQCRYQPGDVLWVRESWAFNTGYDDEYGEGEYVYRADNGQEAPNGKWQPSIYMPRAAARIFLRVTDVRVERLQCITPNDCIAEGMEGIRRTVLDESEYWAWYKELWDSLNAKRGYSWETNPYVWVISFERQ